MDFNEKRPIVFLVSIFIVVNIILIALYVGKSNKNKLKSHTAIQPETQSASNFIYDNPAPDFLISSINGENFRLSEWKGKVIIIKFSQFHLPELSNLLYLEYLARRYPKHVKLLFINSLGKHDADTVNKYMSFSTPITEDNGTINALFDARPNELLIIGKDFKIKYKHYLDKKNISNLVLRYAFGNSSPHPPRKEEISDLIKKINFENLKTKKTENLGDRLKGKNTLIRLSISMCMTCPESTRIRLLKDLSQKINPKKSQCIFLYGKGNTSKLMQGYLKGLRLNDFPIVPGVIIDENQHTDVEYLTLFQFDLDPRIIIFGKNGEVKFLEEIEDSAKILNSGFLKKRL